MYEMFKNGVVPARYMAWHMRRGERGGRCALPFMEFRDAAERLQGRGRLFTREVEFQLPCDQLPVLQRDQHCLSPPGALPAEGGTDLPPMRTCVA